MYNQKISSITSMHPLQKLLIIILLLKLASAATSATSLSSTSSSTTNSISTTLLPLSPTSESSSYFGPSIHSKGSKKGELTRMNLIATIKGKVTSLAPEVEVIGLYNSLIQRFGLNQLNPFGLTCLLEALSQDDAYQLQALDVFNELKKRGDIKHIALKSTIFSNACIYDNTDLVVVLCPIIDVKDRLKVLLEPISSTVLDLVVKSVAETELASAMEFAAEKRTKRLFGCFLEAAKGKKKILNEALFLLGTGKYEDRFVKWLKEVIAECEAIE